MLLWQPYHPAILRTGTYREGNEVLIRKSNITIKSRKGEWAIIELPYQTSGENSAVRFYSEVSNCKLQNVEIIGGFYAVCVDIKWGWHGDDDYVAANNIIIEDCKLHDSRYDVVKIKSNCKNITIRYNEIYKAGRSIAGIQSTNGEGNAEGIDNVNGDNMKV